MNRSQTQGPTPVSGTCWHVMVHAGYVDVAPVEGWASAASLAQWTTGLAADDLGPNRAGTPKWLASLGRRPALLETTWVVSPNRCEEESEVW